MALHMLIAEHRGAFEYDWRTRFGVALSSLPASMDWGEALRLATILAADPSSQVSAALGRWKHALSWEAIAIRDLYDLQHASKSKRKPKPYPRPWDRPAQVHGAGGMPVEEYRALRARQSEN